MVIAVVLLTLLYQRGFVLMGVVLIAWTVERYRKITYRSGVLVAIALVAGLLILRPLAGHMSHLGEPGIESSRGSAGPTANPMALLKNALLFTGNFSLVDTWPVVQSFVETNGRLAGATFWTMPASFTPASFRWRTGLTTIVDRVNYFYYGDVVVNTQWGFNLNLAQNIFANFGPAFMFLGCIPGAVVASFDRRLREVRKLKVLTMFLAAGAFASEGLIGDTGILLSYMVAFVMVGWALSQLARIRFRVAWPVSPAARAPFSSRSVTSGRNSRFQPLAASALRDAPTGVSLRSRSGLA
jgi:hypothetical protein